MNIREQSIEKFSFFLFYMRIETVHGYEFLLKKETVGYIVLEIFRSLGDYLIYTVPMNVDLNRGVRVPGTYLKSRFCAFSGRLVSGYNLSFILYQATTSS